MSFTGQENHEISLQEASEMTKRYRDSQTTEGYIKGEYFGKTALQSLLNQENCVGTRIYYGLKPDLSQCLVLVGVDGSGNDMVNGIILDLGVPCPNSCSTSNALNS